MRISLLCLDPGAPLGGSKGCSIHLRAEAEAWLSAGHAVTAIVANSGPGAGAADLVERGLQIHALPAGADLACVTDALAASEATLVFERLSLMAPEGAIAAQRLGLPHAYEANAPLDEEACRYRGLADRDRARASFRVGFAASHGTIAVSEEVAAWVRDLAPVGHPMAVIPNGVHDFFFSTPLRSSDHPATLAGDRRPPFRIGFAGSLRPWHDLAGLVAATALVRRRFEARLVVVGDGPQRTELVTHAERLQVPIELVGAVPHTQVPAYLANMDVVVVPYATDGLYFSPLKLGEAMACGRPVVASAIGPTRRLLEHLEHGLLVAPGDTSGLAEAVIRIGEDPALGARLGAAARERMRERSWNHVGRDMVEFLIANSRERVEG